VVLATRGGPALEALAADLRAAGGHVVAVPTDLTSAVSVRRLVEQTLGAFGRLDAAINDAHASELSLAMRYEIPAMQPGTRVINLAPLAYGPPAGRPPAFEPPAFEPPAFGPSVFGPPACRPSAFGPSAKASHVQAQAVDVLAEGPAVAGARPADEQLAGAQAMGGLAGDARAAESRSAERCAACAQVTDAQAAVIEVTRMAAPDYAGSGVRLNAVAAGPYGSGSAEDVAAAVLWLCSDDASLGTGQTLHVAGGRPSWAAEGRPPWLTDGCPGAGSGGPRCQPRCPNLRT
jgi:NAD(P)-dependent dehydrogenase (short-subunit alcohol dehydrogenase family)